MKIFKSLIYYVSSIPTIFLNMNFWIIPLILFKKPVLICLKNGMRFFVDDLMSIWTIKEVVLDDNYKVGGDNLDLVIDIGASIGDFSVLVGKNAKKVYSYESSSDCYQLLKRNLMLNNSVNVEISNTVVNSLDPIFESNKINGCDLVKIDCEGAEYGIFKNTSEKNLKRIKRISMEIHLFNKSQVKQYFSLKQRLEYLGFKLNRVYNPVHDYLKFLYARR
ncbi:hypothetical protein A2159_02630 [Candidatus Woesebacteria bacterium RBG_13_34_9]|uniref:Methyltransferase FkbM domain-containing protein n=1 Tax=Candidatus Woesebacteria bacterium RBG_13_34_9 TaxID=1802477 RepID=A0A1F7X051_9BACT|nr:MAG: hypothetical protein A2159_02630 [Candidatus Woesebacteria bacterium RBG_13_34_9]